MYGWDPEWASNSRCRRLEEVLDSIPERSVEAFECWRAERGQSTSTSQTSPKTAADSLIASLRSQKQPSHLNYLLGDLVHVLATGHQEWYIHQALLALRLLTQNGHWPNCLFWVITKQDNPEAAGPVFPSSKSVSIAVQPSWRQSPSSWALLHLFHNLGAVRGSISFLWAR